MSQDESIVSPGGVGFDINCGVRLIRTNLDYKDIEDKKEEIAQTLFNHIPVGVGRSDLMIIPCLLAIRVFTVDVQTKINDQLKFKGSKGVIPTSMKDLEEALVCFLTTFSRICFVWINI